MPTKRLRDEYGGNPRSAMNRAIRAECAGGEAALDALEYWHGVCIERGFGAGGDQPDPYHVQAYARTMEIVDAMEDDVRQRWGMRPRQPREDLRR